MNKLECLTCKTDTGIVTDLESSEAVCTKCGTVVAPINTQTTGPGGRIPLSLNMESLGLSTQVGKTNKDSAGRPVKNHVQNTMKRLRTWDSRIQVRSHSLRTYRVAYTQLNKLKDKLNIPYPVIENAAQIYKKVQKGGLVKGKTISSSVAASLYVACRGAGVPRTLDEIALAADIKRTHLAREYRGILLKLDFKVPQLDYNHCIEKIGARLQLPEKVQRQAMKIMEKILTEGISSGKNPMGMAGAVLYTSMSNSGIKIRQRDIAAASECTEVTLRTRAKGLKKYL